MTPRWYASPLAFKQALEQRLRSESAVVGNVARLRQLVVFDRFLARVVKLSAGTVILKGGLALELRLGGARTTKDVDLGMVERTEDVLDLLQEGGQIDLGDFMRFEVREDSARPELRGPGAPFGGKRFRAECRMGGVLYGRPFGVDVAFGDPVIGRPDVLVADDHLGFAGVSPPTLRLLPVVSHIAEKLHAFTLPRSRPNTRVKDLPDMALLASSGKIDGGNLRRAFEQTFSFRGTHALPKELPEPPVAWDKPYTAMALEDQLPWSTLEDLFGAVSDFLTPVLTSRPVIEWDPSSWRWTSSE